MEAITEKQIFLKKWWGLIIPMVLVPIVVAFFANDKSGVFVPLIGIPLVLLLLTSLSLNTRIDEVGVSFRFAPIMRKPKQLLWSELVKAQVREYEPLSEYGGWGYRKGWKRGKTAYSIYGNYGLELTLLDGKIIMIGTQNKEQLIGYLNYIKTKYGIAAIQ